MRSRADARIGRIPVRADDHGQAQVTAESTTTARLAEKIVSVQAAAGGELIPAKRIPERRAAPGRLHPIRWADRYP
jgi:hypothetical protein